MYFLKFLCCVVIQLWLVGCATSVSKLSPDGKLEQLIFPDQKVAWLKEGSYPNIENLSKVKAGASKDQIYALIGHPHFNEGFGKVREWDYIFNFPTDGTNPETCQFKILYSRELLIQQTFWKPESCEHYAEKLNPPPIIERVIEKSVVTKNVTHTKISSDGFFDFDKWEISNLTAGGRMRLDNFLSTISDKNRILSLTIVGFTDRLGADDYNFKLSHMRANSIKEYLIAAGIPEHKITAYGMGKTNPIVVCNQTKRDIGLIECLAPNRRFELSLETEKVETLENSAVQ